MTGALNADICIASDAARVGSPAARMGLAYGYESVKHLVDPSAMRMGRRNLLSNGKRRAAL